jgi:hypothetical protein
VTAFAAIFNGNPARPDAGDPQLLDNHGFAWRVNDPPWLVGQVRFDYTLPIGSGLAGNFTPGGWYHLGDFNDQRFTAERLSIADPAGSGVPGKLRRNYGIFAVIEQTLYRPPGSTEKGVSASAPGITAFARVAYSPPDRNLIDLYIDGGIGVAGLVSGRPLDRFGIAVAYMHMAARFRYAVVLGPVDTGALVRGSRGADLRGAHQARPAAATVFPICHPPLGRSAQPERCDRDLPDQRCGHLWIDYDPQILRPV